MGLLKGSRIPVQQHPPDGVRPPEALLQQLIHYIREPGELIKPGKIYPLSISLWETSMVFKALKPVETPLSERLRLCSAWPGEQSFMYCNPWRARFMTGIDPC